MHLVLNWTPQQVLRGLKFKKFPWMPNCQWPNVFAICITRFMDSWPCLKNVSQMSPCSNDFREIAATTCSSTQNTGLISSSSTHIPLETLLFSPSYLYRYDTALSYPFQQIIFTKKSFLCCRYSFWQVLAFVARLRNNRCRDCRLRQVE